MHSGRGESALGGMSDASISANSKGEAQNQAQTQAQRGAQSLLHTAECACTQAGQLRACSFPSFMMKRRSAGCRLQVGVVSNSTSNSGGTYHLPSLSCLVYFPELGSSRFFLRALLNDHEHEAFVWSCCNLFVCPPNWDLACTHSHLACFQASRAGMGTAVYQVGCGSFNH